RPGDERGAGGARGPVRRAVQPAGGGVSVTQKPQLLRVSLKRAAAAAELDFPFSIPAIRNLPPLDLSARVTFFVGENGSGKSTLLEGLAPAAGLPTVGAAEVGRYGRDPDARSHGQAFLNLFQGRFVPEGLYLLDEPEAPLSPQNQLGLLALLLEWVGRDAQFIIATHSPMLLAFPDAAIYSFDR